MTHIFDVDRDIRRIQEALRGVGRTVSEKRAQFLWEQYSDSLGAGWLLLPPGGSKGDQWIVDMITHTAQHVCMCPCHD